MPFWDRLPKCGFSRNRQFEQRLNGVEYIATCLSWSALRDSLGGDFYEGSKLALRGAGVTLSKLPILDPSAFGSKPFAGTDGR